MNNKGLTLIEILISISIIATMVYFTTTSMDSATKSREKISEVAQRTAMLRSAFQIIERDINLAFHHRDLTFEIQMQIEEDRQKKEAEEKANNKKAKPENPFAQKAAEKQELAPKKMTKNQKSIEAYVAPKDKTQFLGATDNMHFTSLSHIKTRKDANESKQAEVGYYLKQCRNRLNADHRSNCLWRRSTPYIDDKVEEGGNAVVLLENIKSFELKYLGEKSEEFIEEWRTDDKGNKQTNDRFPVAVQITIVITEEKKEFGHSLVAEIRFPNNKEIKPNNSGGTSGQQPTTQ